MKVFGIVLFGLFGDILGLSIIRDAPKVVMNPEQRLKNDIKCFNDPAVRPVKNVATTTILKFELLPKYALMQLEKRMMAVSTKLTLTWQNEFVKWNPDDYENLTEISLPSNQVWTPQLSRLFNRRNDMIVNMASYPVVIRNDGQTQLVAFDNIFVHCAPNFKHWPSEVDVCKFAYISDLDRDEFLFNITSTQVDMSLYQDSMKWKLVEAKQDLPDWGPWHFTTSSVQFTFTLENRSNVLASVIVLPNAISVIFILLSFWINPLEGFRFVLLIAVMGVHIMYLQYVGTLIRVGEETIYLISYLRNSTILCFLAMVLLRISRTVIVASGEPPVWLKLCKQKLNDSALAPFFAMPKDPNLFNHKENKMAKEWILLAIAFDRICFIIYALLYFTMFIMYD